MKEGANQSVQTTAKYEIIAHKSQNPSVLHRRAKKFWGKFSISAKSS